MIDIAFINHLAMVQSDTDFARAAAGFATLHVYESVKAHSFGLESHEGPLRRIAQDLSQLDHQTGVRAALESVTQALPFWETAGPVRIGRRAVYTALLQYGQALAAEGDWALAASVYALVAGDTEMDGETWLAAEARHLMGRASRMCAEWEMSQLAYGRAYDLALEAGDIFLALRAQIGAANNLWIRGDIPGAKRRLDAIARRARQSCPAVLPRVTLARAAVANVAGEYERAIHLAFGLLASLSETDEVRYQTLVDLAAFLSDYGLPDAAATALRVVERSAPEFQVRRHASLNLFFLAARYEDEATFNRLRSSLATERLTPRQQTQYSLFAAQGYRRFARFEAATAAAERARSLANQFQLFQLLFEAEDELREINTARATTNQLAGAPWTVFDAVGDYANAWDSRAASQAHHEVLSRGKLPPRIRRVTESLQRMATQATAAESGMDAAR